MATSGTSTFESSFYIDDIITEAYERIGRFDYSGNDIKTARRSLNIMFQEWANRGLHYWEVANNSITLVNNQSVYTMFRSTADGTSSATAVYGVDDVLEASYRNASNIDFPLSKINRSAYQGFSNKTDTGTPTQYFVQRLIDRVTITLYLTPGTNEAGNKINYYYVKRIQDAGNYTNEADVPYRFVPCMVSGLAYYLSQKFKPELVQQMKLLYEDELQRALQEDGSPSSLTSGSNVVIVNEPAHGRSTNDTVVFRNVDGSPGGLAFSLFENASGFSITVVDTSSYSFNCGSTATVTGNFGGMFVTAGPVTLTP